MRCFVFLFIAFFLSVLGCVQQPEVPRSSYGTVVNTLPKLEEAEKPFDFPYSEGNDHRNCDFKDDETLF
jgi:hypothetical protein